jgi:hypothetical protein
MHISRLLEGQVIMLFKHRLDDIIAYRFPDALWVDVHWHSHEAATVFVLDLDYSYTGWRAHLSLDHRWTLSPAPGARVVDIPDAP